MCGDILKYGNRAYSNKRKTPQIVWDYIHFGTTSNKRFKTSVLFSLSDRGQNVILIPTRGHFLVPKCQFSSFEALKC